MAQGLLSFALSDGAGGITFNLGQLWKRLACGREVSTRSRARPRTGLTRALFLAKTGDQNPGRGERQQPQWGEVHFTEK